MFYHADNYFIKRKIKNKNFPDDSAWTVSGISNNEMV